MAEEEAESLFDAEVPHVTESDKIKLRLKNFCYVIGILFILWVVSIIIVISNKGNNDTNNSNNGKNNESQSDSDSKEELIQDESYINATKFISNLTSNEIKSLLKGKNYIYNKNENENDKGKICDGQIESFNSSLYPNNVSFK